MTATTPADFAVIEETYNAIASGTCVCCTIKTTDGGVYHGIAADRDDAFGAALEDRERQMEPQEPVQTAPDHISLPVVARAAYASIRNDWRDLTDADRAIICDAANESVQMDPDDDIPESVLAITSNDMLAARFAVVARAVRGV